jgi:RNA polymerase sigma-70 factor (ECF subfamily)
VDDPAIEPRQFTGLNKLLEAILRQLPPVQRAVLMLRDYEGYTYDEIGRITGLTESQVKVYIYRARLAVKKKIEKMENVI